MKALQSLNFINPQVTANLIDYLVKRGYDSDDLMELSSKNGGHRRAIHLI